MLKTNLILLFINVKLNQEKIMILKLVYTLINKIVALYCMISTHNFPFSAGTYLTNFFVTMHVLFFSFNI